jgi:hypothetical protein
MALLKSDFATGAKASPAAYGPGLMAIEASFTLTADLAANDIIQMMDLPANCIPVDIIADWAAMGAGTIGVGVLNTGKTDVTGTLLLASTAVTSAGAARAAVADLKTMRALAPTNTNRPLGVKILTDTSATSGTISITLICRAA